MLKAGGPLTRERFIRLNWAGEVEEPLDAEQEDELPPPFQIEEGEHAHIDIAPQVNSVRSTKIRPK